LFIFGFNILSTILSLPISYYNTFVLEEKFGFNKQTLKLWVTDMLKGQMLGIVLGTPIISAVLKIVQKTGNSFFYYLWLFGVFVQVFAITIYPIAILPLFNKLSPLQPGEIKTGVENLAKKLKFPLSELHVIDGSKRSAHSNAYFYGLPWKKHIVIYDTLLEKSEPQEVVAVLSHELGHWSLSHTTKLFGIAQVYEKPKLSIHLESFINMLYSSTCSTSSLCSPSLSTTNLSTSPSVLSRSSLS
jgi:STE24 endopeptidase